MVTTVAYFGASFTALLCLASVIAAVAGGIAGMWGITAACGCMAAIFVRMIVSNDWPKIWKPLLTRQG